MLTRRPALALTVLAASTATLAGARQPGLVSGAFPYQDPRRPVAERVDDLLARMTVDEKVGQMTQPDHSYLKSPDDVATYLVGSVLSGGNSEIPDVSPAGWAEFATGMQKRALATRLGIPILYGVDAVHGHNNVRGAVVFPHNIGMGCTRNPKIVEEAARVTAQEVAATGMHWVFGPCVTVPQDERWGRTYEGFGETAALAADLGAAAVRGLQGGDLSSPGSVLASAKHYVGDGGTTNGIDQGDTRIDEATLRRIHLPGYVAAVKAGVGSVMASFNTWNGEKLHGHKYLLTTVLKGELGFKGFVVSDWKALEQLPGDYSQQIETSIDAGIDMVSGLPTIVVLLSGRPMILEPILAHADAIVAAWLPGTEGDGVADVLFGTFNPTGKLSHTWPRSMAQIPINVGPDGEKPKDVPLFEYGFGLRYR
jgi:beta-glucosidase